jgi:DNA polymerase III gamma/tau subunit
MPLQHLYRPQELEFFYGNEALKKSLTKALTREDDIPSSYFIKGPPGCGKTSLAEIIAAELGIPEHDIGYNYYDAATTRGIDTIRTIRDRITYGGKQVYVLDEFHQCTSTAAEGLLIALENPPPDKYFILCTSEPGKIKTTIKRRCMNLEVKPLSFDEMHEFLEDVLATEDVKMDDRITQAIRKNAQGSPGIALSIMDGVIDIYEDVDASMKMVEAWSEVTYDSLELCRAIAAGRWREAQTNLKNNKTSAIILKGSIMGYLRKIMLNESRFAKAHEAAQKMIPFTEMRVEDGNAGLALAVFMACNTTEDDIPF